MYALSCTCKVKSWRPLTFFSKYSVGVLFHFLNISVPVTQYTLWAAKTRVVFSREHKEQVLGGLRSWFDRTRKHFISAHITQLVFPKLKKKSPTVKEILVKSWGLKTKPLAGRSHSGSVVSLVLLLLDSFGFEPGDWTAKCKLCVLYMLTGFLKLAVFLSCKSSSCQL